MSDHGHPTRRADHQPDDNHPEHELTVFSSSESVKTPVYAETISLLDTKSTNTQGREEDADAPPTKSKTNTKRLSGWKVGAVTGAGLATIALALNVAALVWLQQHPAESTGLVEVYRGSCQKVEDMQMWMHFAINALSAVLLASSNYCMQVLSAPTRAEIDKSHESGKYLDIGVQSIRNLSKIAPWRVFIWVVIGLSSAPLHLMYNSAFYSSIAANSYEVFFMTGDYASYRADQGMPPDGSAGRYDMSASAARLEELVGMTPGAGTLELLDPGACLNAYARPLVTDRSNLIVVTKGESEGLNGTALIREKLYNFPSSIANGRTQYDPYGWVCHRSDKMMNRFGGRDATELRPCDAWVDKIKNDIGAWTPLDYSVDFCLSESIEERCSFNGNMQILAVVITSNALKIVCMLIVAFGLGTNQLITVGDAIACFLKKPDPSTQGYCLMSKRDVIDFYRLSEATNDSQDLLNTHLHTSKAATGENHRWSKAASRARWSWTMGSILLALLVVGAFFAIGAAVFFQFGVPFSELGFGKLHPAAIITGMNSGYQGSYSTEVLNSVLMANAPQLILSFLYLHLNSLVTCMWLASEWNDFASERKTLRVSIPEGDQRSTYRLQLPYRVAIPLMIGSGLLHWLISQSLFLAVVAEYDWDGSLQDPIAIATCGYSLTPMIVLLSLGIAICAGTIWLGRGRYLGGPGFMPLAGSCSLAIAAACHAPEEEKDAPLKAVMWGAVPEPKIEFQNKIDGSVVGHCSFSSNEVEQVVEGKMYA
ncbi:uncharacterized protein HMPREF1541_08413 [Cyphellophora europaea CBS 101466]|uniref:DUF6536 domain-containing protein n=1 Tax=Cyphellophora europaea (strain CBS 101466) TaxID=1220924 RepID=W2RLT3_CYPE1|nr:uncharacterized protein HMPREF1541_08413 [Cyphellophora europaea CBS 101466]ETN37422.1 hypothetical protein HMPREF1541_08413 [Cyphellophora europaea CBS 101466]